jgi:CDP-4-dehydro-6-deoxyglucose reductase, E1
MSDTRLNELRAEILRLTREYAGLQYAPQPFQPNQQWLHAAGKVLGADELEYLVDASLDGWLTTGRYNEAFEASLGKYIGVSHVATVNSGSSANLVAFSALTSPKLGDRAIRPGDEVITVAAGFPTTVNPILQSGAVPVFVDIQLPTYNIDPTYLEAARSERTKAVVIAHTLGNPFDVEAVVAFCRRHGLWLIEDCCDALGATYSGRMVGTFGDIATLSFYPAHHITMGEGGAVFTNHDELKPLIESFRDWGRDCWCAPGRDNTCGKRFDWQLGELPYGYDHKFIYSHAGYNLKITDMQAAVGLAQLQRVPDFIARRRHNFKRLTQALKPCAGQLILPQATPKSDPSWFGFPITVDASANVDRVELLRYLDQHRINTRLLFGGNLTRQPYFKGRQYRIAGELAVTDRIMADTFWIGVWPGLTDEMIDFIAARIGEFFGVGF